jgi:hypothetical protein
MYCSFLRATRSGVAKQLTESPRKKEKKEKKEKKKRLEA